MWNEFWIYFRGQSNRSQLESADSHLEDDVDEAQAEQDEDRKGRRTRAEDLGHNPILSSDIIESVGEGEEELGYGGQVVFKVENGAAGGFK